MRRNRNKLRNTLVAGAIVLGAKWVFAAGLLYQCKDRTFKDCSPVSGRQAVEALIKDKNAVIIRQVEQELSEKKGTLKAKSDN